MFYRGSGLSLRHGSLLARPENAPRKALSEGA
jgi:hypothetical protein